MTSAVEKHQVVTAGASPTAHVKQVQLVTPAGVTVDVAALVAAVADLTDRVETLEAAAE